MNPKELRITHDNFGHHLFVCVREEIERYLFQDKTSFEFQFKVFICGFNYIVEGCYDINNDNFECDYQSIQAFRTERKNENEVTVTIIPDLTVCKTDQERFDIMINEIRNEKPDEYNYEKGCIY